MEKYRISAEEARRVCQPQEVEEEHSLDMPIDFVGQERAEKAFNLALSSESKFHIAVVAENISLEIIKQYIRKVVEERKARGEKFSLKDYCQVYNFDRPENPSLLTLDAGQGSIFKLTVKRIRERLQKEIPTAFSAESFEEEKAKITRDNKRQMLSEHDSYFKEVIEKEGWVEEWRQRGVRLTCEEGEGIILTAFFSKELFTDEDWNQLDTQIQLFLIDKLEGQRIDQKTMDSLPASLRKQYEKYDRELQEQREKIFRTCRKIHQRLQEEMDQKIKELEEKVYQSVLEKVFKRSVKRYLKHPRAEKFLEDLKDHARANKDSFIPPPAKQVMTPMGPVEMVLPNERTGHGKDPLIPFEVNLLVDNKETEAPPIVIASSPTYAELFGKVERKIVIGGPETGTATNPTMIKPGAFHQASGGFVILDLTDIVTTKNLVYLGLRRVLREQQLRIRDPNDEYGVSYMGEMLNPEPVPLELKVIAVIHPTIYYLLWRHLLDRDLMQTFDISALFDRDIAYRPENFKAYASWMQEYAQRKGFYQLDSEAKARIIEFLLREAENQERFLWDIEKVKFLIKEAYSYAREEGAESIQREHVSKAIYEKIYRSNLFEERIHRAVEEGKILIETGGRPKVGQINGLAVYSLDDYSFGIPSRITVSTYKGRGGLINIERKAGLDEETHTLGVEILQGFFNERYGQDKDLSFEGRVVFEQHYEGIGGPSASAAELFALLSSLSGKPIKQSIAITGTVDQKGNIQTIGGVNQKIEGFFKVCKAQGLTEEHGVIIPKANAKGLMLSDEVVQAIREGKFHVCSIERVEQGVEILMDCSMEDVDDLVNKELKKWSKGRIFPF